MLLCPALRGENHITDPPIDIRARWNREPLHAIRGLDAVSVAPVVLRVLNVIVKHEEVDIVNDVEVSLPRNVVGLQDCNPTSQACRLGWPYPMMCALRRACI